MCIWRQCNRDPSASLGMTVLGEWIDSQGGKACMEAASPLFLLGRCPEVAFKSPVTPTIRGKESSHMRGVRSFDSVPTCSGWGFSTHRAFSSAQDDDTGKRKGSHLGDTLRVLELSVLYTIRVGPWRRAAPKAQDGST